MRTMGKLYLVRHGQASFGADNYDQLSDLGHRQAQRLGEYFAGKGLRFETSFTGTLQRQIQTHAGIAQGLGQGLKAVAVPGLNEYDSHALIATVHPEPLARPDTPELYRHHFRLLRRAMQDWMAGRCSPVGMPSYGEWGAGIREVLDRVRAQHTGDVLLVSSGGPIATAVGQVLGLAPEMTIELNLRIRNASITEFEFNPKRHTLLTYNTLPHLDGPGYAGWVTYA